MRAKIRPASDVMAEHARLAAQAQVNKVDDLTTDLATQLQLTSRIIISRDHDSADYATLAENPQIAAQFKQAGYVVFERKFGPWSQFVFQWPAQVSK